MMSPGINASISPEPGGILAMQSALPYSRSHTIYIFARALTHHICLHGCDVTLLHLLHL
jgi:hypothetical protein